MAHECRAGAHERHASHAQPDDRRLGAGRHFVIDFGGCRRGALWVGSTRGLDGCAVGCLFCSFPPSKPTEVPTHRIGRTRLIDLMVTIGLIRPAKSRILAISTHPRHNSFVSHMQTIKKTYSPLVLPEHGRASAVDVRPSAVRRASGRLERRERRRFRRRRLLFGRDLRP